MLQRHARATQYELIVVNGQSTTSQFHKVVWQQYLREVGKKLQSFTSSFFVMLCTKKKSKSANFSQRYSKSKSGTYFLRHGVCTSHVFVVLQEDHMQRQLHRVHTSIDVTSTC